jgi:hypothetical protein
MAGVGDFKALLRDLVFVLITIHSSALFKIYLYTLRYRDIGWRRLSPPRGASWEPLEMTSLESRAESKQRAIHS